MDKQPIKLGDEIEDVVAKVSGIAVGRIEYLDGSVYWLIQPPAEDRAILAKEVHSHESYCIRIGDGVRIKRKQRLGFTVEDELG